MKKSNFEKLKLALLWVFAFIVIIFIMAFTSHAEGTADGSLPYKKSQILTYNSFMSDDILDKLRLSNLPIDENNYVLMYSDHSVFTQYPQYNNQLDVAYYFFLLPIEDFNSVSSGYNFYYNNLNVNLTPDSSYYYISVVCDYSANFDLIAVRTPSYATYSTSLYQSGMFGHIPSVDNTSNFTFTPFTPVFFNNDFFSSNDVLVLDDNTVPNPIDFGVAIVPPDAFVPDYPTGTTPPAQVPPTYTPTDYNWTTPPTFDSSSVTNAIGSIQNTLGWLANNLKEEFKNITDNGKHFFEYIGKTIQYYGNAIIETLNNLMQNFYDNMKSLVEPIYTKIEGLYNDFLDFADLFINPFDEEEFEEQINSCQLITRYNELLDNCEVIQQIFDETSEPDSFILYIDFENPFADSEHKIISSEINFNWLVPLRPVYRPFLIVFTLIECFVGGFRILGNIIGGKAK